MKIKYFLFLFLNINFIFSNNKNIKIEENFIKFQNFIKTYNKSYNSFEEFNFRYSIFLENLQFIKNLEAFKNKTSNLKFGITKFFDLSQEEFKANYLTLKNDDKRFLRELPRYDFTPSFADNEYPENFDWRDFNVMGPVKKQGKCGGCWAFTTVGTIEAYYTIKTGKKKVFSEQQLLDCNKLAMGCDGGNMRQGYEYLVSNGLMLQEEYPFELENPKKNIEYNCRYNEKNTYVKVKHFEIISKDEEEMKKILYEKGPLSASINSHLLMFYKDGIFDPYLNFICKTGVNHAVILVGYGVENGVKYWTVKNSWGDNWGDNGYFKIKRGEGLCGINYYTLYAEINELE
jgi:cathepsin F